MIDQEGFVLELTGAEASSQNGIAESPNRVLAQMMRCALYSADLGPEYWSYALQMVVYVKNRLPHRIIDTTPYQKLTGNQPNVSKIRIFGSRVYACIPGSGKFSKSDLKNTDGIFLGYTATDNNVYFEDDATHQVLISTHVLFDEAHLSVPNSFVPIGAQALQRTGYSPEDEITGPKIYNMHTNISLPFHVTLSPDPFDDTINIPIYIKGIDPCLGLHLKTNDDFGRLQLVDCIPGTPATKIPEWRSILRHIFVNKYDGISVSS